MNGSVLNTVGLFTPARYPLSPPPVRHPWTQQKHTDIPSAAACLDIVYSVRPQRRAAAPTVASEMVLASSGSSSARYGFSGSVRWQFMAMQSEHIKRSLRIDKCPCSTKLWWSAVLLHHLMGLDGSVATRVWWTPTGCPAKRKMDQNQSKNSRKLMENQ